VDRWRADDRDIRNARQRARWRAISRPIAMIRQRALFVATVVVVAACVVASLVTGTPARHRAGG
jgi:hypothetical protein